MPIHPFNFSPKNLDAGVRLESTPVMPVKLQNQPNLNRVQSIDHDPINVATEDVNNVFPIGTKTMDRGVKEFFSDIDVPTKDGTRKMEVRVAGGDKTILFWKQLMEQDNRIRLPVMSVNKTGWRHNPGRYIPASVTSSYYRHFADDDKSRMVLTPKEYSLIIDYTLSIWAERKRDIEYIMFQIVSRFNPVAQWGVEDEFMCGDIYATFEGANDNSDIDIGSNELAKVRYDITIKIEGWMPLPGRVVPTVLGQVTELAELDTREFFEVIKSNGRG